MLKRIKNNLGRWFSRDYYLPAAIFLFGGIVLIFSDLIKPSIHSEEDLYTVQGRYLKRSFVYVQGRGGGYNYELWLDNYSNAFRIRADFIPEGLKEQFNANMKKMENLTLKIANEDSVKLNSGETIFVYGIQSDYYTFLHTRDTIAIHNDKLGLWLSFGLITSGLFYYLLRKRYLKKKRG